MTALLRLAGRAALIAALVHVLQFLVLGIGPVLQEPAYPEPARAGDNFWFGLAGLVTATAIALAYLVFFPAATALTRGDAPTDAIWRTAMNTVAGIGIGAWLIAGGTNLARRGFNATAIDAASGGDAEIGRAVLQGAYLTTSAAAIAASVAFAVWFVAFAVRGIRARAFGWGVAAVAVVSGLVPVLGWAVNLGGVPVIVLGLFVIGPVLLVRSKNTTRTSVAVAE